MGKSIRALKPRLRPLSVQERDLLYQLYVEENMNAEQIANKFGRSERLVFMRLRQHAIRKTGYKKKVPAYCLCCGRQWEPVK